MLRKKTDRLNRILKTANEERCPVKCFFKKLQIVAEDGRMELVLKC